MKYGEISSGEHQTARLIANSIKLSTMMIANHERKKSKVCFVIFTGLD